MFILMRLFVDMLWIFYFVFFYDDWNENFVNILIIYGKFDKEYVIDKVRRVIFGYILLVKLILEIFVKLK